MEFVLEEGKHLHEKCSTLILPALSIGNVGQLAIDLLVSSMRAERIGYLDDPSVLPCVGNDAYGPVPQGVLALPIEAYDSLSDGLTLIQQRSPIVKILSIRECHLLVFLNHPGCGIQVWPRKGDRLFLPQPDFASSGKKHIVVLSSLDSGRREKIDASSSTQIYYLSSTNTDGTDDDCEKLGWTRLQEYNSTQRLWKYLNDFSEGNSMQEDNLCFEDELVAEDYYPSLPFAALFSGCKAKGLKVTCILCYCSEGDNISDSFRLAEAACKLLRKSTENFCGNDAGGWLIPFSWKTVYGPPPDMSLF